MTESIAKNQDTQAQQRSFRPPVDVVENGVGITLYADMPGVSKDDLHVHVEGDTLQIEGAVKLTTTDGLQPVYVEVNRPNFHRAFTLSRELDTAKIEAALENGVLRLYIPKTAEAQPRRIEIKTA